MNFEETIIFFLRKAAYINEKIKECEDGEKRLELIEELNHYNLAIRCLKEASVKNEKDKLSKWVEGKMKK